MPRLIGFAALLWMGVLCAQKIPATYSDSDFRDLDPASELRPLILRFTEDLGVLSRKYPIERSAYRAARMKAFYEEWNTRLDGMPFDTLGQDGRADWILLRNHLRHRLRKLEMEQARQRETGAWLPFSDDIVGFDEACRRMEPMDGAKSARTLERIAKSAAGIRDSLEAEQKKARPDRNLAWRAAESVAALRKNLKHWFDFYNGYDPLFTWWCAQPYKAGSEALDKYESFLREKLAGVKVGDPAAITGAPIGREALVEELANEMIPYSPEELIELAGRELAWCENEMKRASRELGFGDEWRKALEHVKTLHAEPGKQPELILGLAREAEEFLDRHGLITIPPLAREAWRMEMMAPARQLVNPFFTGGEVIHVSYPTADMTEEQKLMSMRGNNVHFSRATVFHELIPGHHLQLFMNARYRPYREVFSTPFAVEGWSLYWELLLWDMNFARSAEDRVGMLFWRMHRCARIVFSLSFHLGKMSAEECVDFLVERVGHERENAAGEVRRSFGGSYSPLYQAAYLLGGMQIYALRRELVESGKMTNREFHDAFLREHEIPIELVRAKFMGRISSREFVPAWRFR